MEYEIGIPQTIGFRIILERVKEDSILTELNALCSVKYFIRLISNYKISLKCKLK